MVPVHAPHHREHGHEQGGRQQNGQRGQGLQAQQRENRIRGHLALDGLGQDTQEFSADDDGDEDHEDGRQRLGQFQADHAVEDR